MNCIAFWSLLHDNAPQLRDVFLRSEHGLLDNYGSLPRLNLTRLTVYSPYLDYPLPHCKTLRLIGGQVTFHRLIDVPEELELVDCRIAPGVRVPSGVRVLTVPEVTARRCDGPCTDV